MHPDGQTYDTPGRRNPVDSPDVQASLSPWPYRLTRVGVRKVRKPVTVHRPGQEPHGVVADFEMYVDLPSHQKGTHMSRNLEALADVLDEEIVDREARSLENLCRRLVLRLLEKHDYASDALVRAEADLFLDRVNPGGKTTVEAYRIRAEAFGVRAPDAAPVVRRSIGVEAIGMSACPCAMETARHKMADRAPADDVPFITHNQRNRVVLRIDVPDGMDVEAAELVDVCEAALSAPTYGLLKRGDEGDLVIQAHESPKFVEDVVREVLHLVLHRWASLPDATRVFASSEAEESIHKHNAYAERETTLGALRA